MASESTLERKLTKWCKDNEVYTRKFSSPSNRGVPDRIYALNGKVVFLELKAEGKKPTKLQLRELKLLGAKGIDAAWVDNFEDAVWFLQDVFFNCQRI